MKRIATVQATGLKSSYGKKYRPQEKWDVSVFKAGAYVCPDMLETLRTLVVKVEELGGQLLITDLYRDWATQAQARADYEARRKKAFVARPGESWHNAGRAVDFAVKQLNFPHIPREHWLQQLWDLAKPLGWDPVINIPDVDASEAWHIEYRGPWAAAARALPYDRVARCATLDIGGWDPETSDDVLIRMFIQAQLIRLGQYDIGQIDGVIGYRTQQGIDDAMANVTTVIDGELDIAAALASL